MSKETARIQGCEHQRTKGEEKEKLVPEGEKETENNYAFLSVYNDFTTICSWPQDPKNVTSPLQN